MNNRIIATIRDLFLASVDIDIDAFSKEDCDILNIDNFTEVFNLLNRYPREQGCFARGLCQSRSIVTWGDINQSPYSVEGVQQVIVLHQRTKDEKLMIVDILCRGCDVETIRAELQLRGLLEPMSDCLSDP